MWRVVVTGVFEVYAQRVADVSVLSPGSVWRMLVTLRDVLLDNWNSMSGSVEHDGARYLVHFELRAQEGGGPIIQRLVDESNFAGGGNETEIHQRARWRGRNVVITLPKDIEGRHIGRGRTPHAPPFHRGHDRRRHQPWSNLIVLGPGHSRFTIAHEVGHVLGLGEGYYDHLTWGRSRHGSIILGDTEQRTVPGAEGTPMALSQHAGRDANADQLGAILGYALSALAASPGVGQFGREVDGYRARQASP